MNQQSRYKSKWYESRGQTPPNLGRKEKTIRKKEPCTMTITDTYVVDGFQPEVSGDDHLDMSYWETRDAGMEPLEFFAARNAMKSDSVVSWSEFPAVGEGEINKCFTPYENDMMSYGAMEVMRLELKNRGRHLANEMKRVDDEFYRPPKQDWFCIKGPQFTIEHVRYNELRRRNAAKWAFKDYYDQVASESS